MTLITIADLEIYLKTTISDGNPSIDTADEALYGFLITAISEYIELYCGRVFTATDYIIQVDGNGVNDLILDNPPIISLTSAKYVDISGNTTEIDTDDIKIDYKNGILYKSTDWTQGRYNVEITYSAGYSNIPDGLKNIVCEAVVSSYNKIGTTIGIKKEKLGDYSYELFENQDDEAQFNSKLDLYKIQDID